MIGFEDVETVKWENIKVGDLIVSWRENGTAHDVELVVGTEPNKVLHLHLSVSTLGLMTDRHHRFPVLAEKLANRLIL